MATKKHKIHKGREQKKQKTGIKTLG